MALVQDVIGQIGDRHGYLVGRDKSVIQRQGVFHLAIISNHALSGHIRLVKCRLHVGEQSAICRRVGRPADGLRHLRHHFHRGSVQQRVEDVGVTFPVLGDRQPVTVAHKIGVSGYSQVGRPQVIDQLALDIADVSCHRIVVFLDDARIAVGPVETIGNGNAVVGPTGRFNVAPERSHLHECGPGLVGAQGLRIHQIHHPLGQEAAHAQGIRPGFNERRLGAPPQPFGPVRATRRHVHQIVVHRPEEIAVEFVDPGIRTLKRAGRRQG